MDQPLTIVVVNNTGERQRYRWELRSSELGDGADTIDTHAGGEIVVPVGERAKITVITPKAAGGFAIFHVDGLPQQLSWKILERS